MGPAQGCGPGRGCVPEAGQLSDAYSPLKGLRHLDVIQGVREGRPVRPVHVQLILSDLCNQACVWCSYRDPSYTSSQLFYQIEPGKKGLRRDEQHPERNYNPNRMIAGSKAIEILDDCAAMGVNAVQFTGGGEPTVHPEWLLTMRAAHSRGMKVSLVTNGVNIGKGLMGPDVAEISDWVRVSIDAATPGVYAPMRNVPEWHFKAACDAVRGLKALPSKCVVGVGFVVSKENWHEVYAACELARDLGADNIRISAQFSAQDEHLFSEFHDQCAAECVRAESLNTDTFTVINRFGQKMDDLKSKSPDYDLCGYQFFTTYIGADLNVYRCCVTSYNEQGLVGSIKDQRFQDLWLSQERADNMAAFKAKSCDRCQFNGQNRTLDYVLRAGPPLHSEFV